MRNLLFAVACTFLAISGCILDENNNKLVLINHSMHVVYFYALTDTVLTMKYVAFLPGTPDLTLSPRDSGYPLFARKGEDWTYKINTICRDSLLKLFIFNADTARKYGWKNVIKFRKYM